MNLQAKYAFLAMILLLLVGCAQETPPEPEGRSGAIVKEVGIFLYAQHPVIEKIHQGFREKLDTITPASYRISYTERNADGDAMQNKAIASFFNDSSFDLIFVVGLPAAQALKSAGVTSPVVFGGPPDPVRAGLVPSLQGHGTNFTGTRFFPPVRAILDFFTRAYPDAEEVAVLHNPGETNSMVVVSAFLDAAEQRSLRVRDLGPNNAAEIEAALRDLSIDTPAGLFLPTDNLIYSNLDRILGHAKALDIPVFNCTRLSVERGASFSLATDYSVVGALTAELASEILFNAARPEGLDVLDIKQGELYVDSKNSLLAGIEPPENYQVVRIQ